MKPSQIPQGQKSNGRTVEGKKTNTNSKVTTATTNGIYDSLSPPLSPVEAPQNPPQHKASTKQQLKMSKAQSRSSAYDRLSPIELASIRQESERNSHQDLTRSRSNPVEPDRMLQNTSTSSAGSDSNQSCQQKGGNTVLKYSYPGPSSQQRKTSEPSHIPVSSANSDTSTAVKEIKKHMRRHSYEDNNITKTFSSTSSSLQRPVRQSESNLDRNVYSPSRSSSASLGSSPEPSLDRQPQSDGVEKVQLDINWSQQSLNRRVSDVAVTTVQALSTLIEVITPVDSPKKTSQDCNYENTPIDNKWYTEVDDNDSDSSSLPLSPEVPTTSPSESTSSPPITSPHVVSVGVGMLPTVSRLPASAKEMLSSEKEEAPAQGRHSVCEGGASGTHVERSKQEEMTIKNVCSTSKPQHETGSIDKLQCETENIEKPQCEAEGVENKLSVQDDANKSKPGVFNGHECASERTSEEDLDKTKSPLVKTDSKVSEDRQGSTRDGNFRSKDHDYEVIDPIEHDYAILEPEGHNEFFGELPDCLCCCYGHSYWCTHISYHKIVVHMPFTGWG